MDPLKFLNAYYNLFPNLLHDLIHTYFDTSSDKLLLNLSKAFTFHSCERTSLSFLDIITLCNI